jgi:hypothetical protein
MEFERALVMIDDTGRRTQQEVDQDKKKKKTKCIVRERVVWLDA